MIIVKINKKSVLIAVMIVLGGLSFMPLFVDPFHQKTEPVCFWEWIGKEIWEIFNGEVEPNPNMP